MDTQKYPGVRDVLAIPRQEILYTVMSDGGDVKRINGSFGRQDCTCHDFIGNSVNFGIAR
jgi:hypothetical protein